ncbi:hypothetical protein J5Y03_12795 [Bacillus sp. RG28]|uniref:Uncharacterized protein n=1 Tax=Gottfriedia endophytica TaxID=2820819 RepID=A0A940NS62_9BACI|nr:hypothetical protein [Gottfriedia endophytica]MBP0726052.1 hypothetical protein [Gottfriedia endophytica]
MALFLGKVIFFILFVLFGITGYFYILKSSLNLKDAISIDPKPKNPSEE